MKVRRNFNLWLGQSNKISYCAIFDFDGPAQDHNPLPMGRVVTEAVLRSRILDKLDPASTKGVTTTVKVILIE